MKRLLLQYDRAGGEDTQGLMSQVTFHLQFHPTASLMWQFFLQTLNVSNCSAEMMDRPHFQTISLSDILAPTNTSSRRPIDPNVSPAEFQRGSKCHHCCHWARGVAETGQTASPSQGHTETNETLHAEAVENRMNATQRSWQTCSLDPCATSQPNMHDFRRQKEAQSSTKTDPSLDLIQVSGLYFVCHQFTTKVISMHFKP